MKKIANALGFVVLVLTLILSQTAFAQTTMFSDNFESGTADTSWGVYRANEENVTAVTMATAPAALATGGSYVGYLQDVNASYSGAAIALAGSKSLRDYSIEADVYCYVGQSVSAYTGLCVYSDSAKATYIKMVADFDASQRIRLSNNKLDPVTFLPTFDHTFAASDIPGGIPTADGWHKMKVEVRTTSPTKTSFWCYFDGQLLGGCPVVDSSIHVMNQGKFGLYAFQQDADGIPGYFDNVVVRLLPTPVDYSENFESGTADTSWGVYRANEENVTAVTMATAPAALATGGSYVGYLQDVNASYSGAAIALNGASSLHDYSIEADVYCYVGQSVSAYTGRCVYSDSAKATYIKMAADFDASQRIRLSNNKLDPVTFLPTFDHTFAASDIPGGVPTVDGWHKMKVEVRTTSPTKTSFWCYFDGQLLGGCPVVDSSIHVMNQGKFGLYAFQQDADGIPGYFDNIVVKSLSATSVREYNSSNAPSDFHLQQNYPNPFNPETRISYRLSVDGFVSLTIYDQLGRRIRTLISENQASGVHLVTWNGKDEFGSSVPSGVYFYSLKAGTIAESRKMVLLK